MMDKKTYLKNFSQSLRNYEEENNVLDLQLIRKLHDYALNLDNISLEEKSRLDTFIDENTIRIWHVANLFLDKKGEEVLNDRLTFMMPIKAAKPQSRIRLVKGKADELVEATSKRTIKVLKKKYRKAA